MRRSIYPLICAGALLVMGPTATANTVQDALGQGARAKAMGGAGTASSEDASSVYYNPAGLGDCAKNEVNFELSHLVYAVDVKSDDPRAEDGALRDRTAMGISGCVQLPARLHAGFLFDTGLQTAQTLDQSSLRSKPEYALYGNALEQVSMIAGLGMRVNEKFSVGLGGALLVNSGLGVGISVPVVAGQDELSGDLQWTLEPAVAAYAGAKYRVNKSLTLGASFRSALFHKLQAEALTTVDVAGVLLDVDLLLESVAWYSPMQASIGVAYDSALAYVTADLTWYRWSAYPGPYIHLSPVDPDESIAAALNYPPDEEPNFSDIIVPRIGVERALRSDLQLRGGLSYRQTPAPTPDPAGRANLLDASVASLSLGLGYSYRGGTIAFFARVHHMVERSVRKEIADEADLQYRFGGALFDTGVAVKSSW